jgi:hypothetical protein
MSRRAGKLLLRARSHGNSPCRPPGQVCTHYIHRQFGPHRKGAKKKKNLLTLRLHRLELRFPAR